MAENEVKVAFGGDAGELQDVLGQVTSIMTQATDSMKQSVSDLSSQTTASMNDMTQAMSSGFQGISSSISDAIGWIGKLTSVLAGGAIFGEVISKTNQWTKDVRGLAAMLGESTDKVSGYAAALTMIGKSVGDLEGMLQRMERRISAQPAMYEALGVTIKDVNTGAMLPMMEIFKNTITRMQDFKAGHEQAQFAVKATGRAFKELIDYQKLTNEMMQLGAYYAKAYGIVVSEDDVNASKEFTKQQGLLELATVGLFKQINTALLPILTDLAAYFTTTGPAAITWFGKAIQTIIVVIDGLVVSVKLLILQMANLVAYVNAVGSISKGAQRQAIHADDQGTAEGPTGPEYPSSFGEPTQPRSKIPKMPSAEDTEDAKTGWDHYNEVVAENTKKTEEILKSASDRIGPQVKSLLDISGEGPEVKPWSLKSGTETVPENVGKGGKGGAGGAKAEKSRVPEWTEELQEQQVSGDESAEGYKISKAAEVEFWQDKLALCTEGTTEYRQVYSKLTAVYKSIASEQSARDKADQAEQEQANSIQFAAEEKHEQALSSLKLQELDYRHDMGQISDAQYYEQVVSEENRVYQARLNAMTERASLPGLELAAYEKVLADIEALQDAHNAKMKSLNNKAALDMKLTFENMLSPISSAISQTVQGMIQGTTTLKNGLKNLFQSILSSFISMAAGMVTKWLASKMLMLAQSMGFFTAEQAATATAETTKTAETVAGEAARSAAMASAAAVNTGVRIAVQVPELIADSAIVFAGVFANMAPYLGAAAAIPAAASQAEVLAQLPLVAARGGMEVDKDQIIKVHENEVVLPAVWSARLKTLTDAIPKSGGDSGGWAMPGGMDKLKGQVSDYSLSSVMTGQSASGTIPPSAASQYSGGDQHIHIHATDAKSFEQQLTRSGSHLNKMMKQAHRNFQLRRNE
jgi:hypothetical protein